jgi:pimeloyl-ACP methyl ester carboxylesterase
MADIVVVHGGWAGGWAWKKMRPLLATLGHTLWAPTLTGLGERAHLANPSTNLETHIQDVVAAIEIEDLRSVVLVGHSSSGLVAAGTADRLRERIEQIVYLDAYVPRDGDCLFDLLGLPAQALRGIEANAIEGWKIPPRDMPPDTSPEDLAWATPRRLPQPIRTFDTPVRLRPGELEIPKHYIYCSRSAPGDGFRPFYERARTEAGWSAMQLDASHNPNITAPKALAALLHSIAATS